MTAARLLALGVLVMGLGGPGAGIDAKPRAPEPDAAA
ncbi:MAG: hypothetical protein QOD56_2958, partial [Gammaproteobacteria bacterium]|nr:hypothetical protein [Gammaproteobacteria bacterium]